MNLKTYLLVKIQEEHLEAAMGVGKAVTFGIDDINPGNGLSNRENYLRESIDIECVKYLANKLTGLNIPNVNIPTHPDSLKYFYWKLGKLIYYTLISNQLGQVEIPIGEHLGLITISKEARAAYDQVVSDLLLPPFFNLP